MLYIEWGEYLCERYRNTEILEESLLLTKVYLVVLKIWSLKILNPKTNKCVSADINVIRRGLRKFPVLYFIWEASCPVP